MLMKLTPAQLLLTLVKEDFNLILFCRGQKIGVQIFLLDLIRMSEFNERLKCCWRDVFDDDPTWLLFFSVFLLKQGREDG